MRRMLACLIAAFVGLDLARAENTDGPQISGDLNAYYDTRGYPTTTINVYGSNLPGKTDFFGFIDGFGSRERPTDLKSYGEFSLSRKIWNGIGPKIEYDRDFSAPSGVARGGFTFEPNLRIQNGFIGVTFYPFATKKDGMQVVLYGGKSSRDGDVYVRGFVDLNDKPGGIIPFSKVQVGKRVGGRNSKWYAVFEGRYDGFAQGKQRTGIGIGIERKF
jgi:hypothetical protein